MSASRRLSAAADGRSRAPSVGGGPTIGQAVEVQGNRGIVRFSGTTEFASGRWLGIELEQRHGKNDGSVQGKRYFECQADHGVFVRASQVKILASSSGESAAALGSSSRSTIHGTEIQQQSGAGESRLRPPPPVSAASPPPGGSASGLDALRNARRASALPGRLVPPSSGSTVASLPGTPSGLPPVGSSRLSGTFSQHSMETRRSTLTGIKSPTPSGIRSSSRQAVGSDGGSAGSSRPMSREYAAAPRLLGTEPQGSSPSPTTATDTSNAARQLQPRIQPPADTATATPASTKHHVSATEEAQRTPYRPALSMNESSTYDMQTLGTLTMSSQTVPLKQFEELRLKYKFIEQKRSEDRQRLQEADGIRAEAEQALRVRDKLAAKVTAQQEEMRALKAKLKEVGAERERSETDHSDALEMVEMLSLDKEMAEEKAESLAQEISMLREQLDEATTSLDVYRQEADLHGTGGSADGSNPATLLEFMQQQKQNERLKEALMRLRDVNTENETQFNQKIKHFEREVQNMQELLDENSSLKEAVLTRDMQIEDLKERLDDSFGAEEMIEDLSERNLTLSGKVEELQSIVENLEALCEVNNEMEEARTEELQGQRLEIDKLGVVINDKNNSIDKLEEAVAVFQYNIGQYRELVTSLQGDMQRLREREQTQATDAATMSSRTQEMESLSLQLRSTMLKTKAKAIDLEMQRLEADQAAEQLRLTAPFLPDHFYRSENEALKTLLAFKRLAAKGGILCKQLEQEEKTEVAISDNFVATAEVRALLIQLSGYAGLFVSFLSTCSDTEFMRLGGSLLHDTQGVERRLNGLVELLRKEEFRASETLPEIRRLAAQLLGLAEAHIAADGQATAGPRLRIMVGRVAYGSDVQLANLLYIEQLLLASGPTTADDDGSSAGAGRFSQRDQQRIAGEVVPAVASVVQNCKASKAVAIKLLKRSEELVVSGSAVGARAFEQLEQLMQMSRELSDYCVRSRTVVQDGFATARAAEDASAREVVDLGKLLQDVSGIAQDVFGASDAIPMGLALGTSQRLTKELASALAYVTDSANASPMEAVEAPWIGRAAQFKAGLVQNADVARRTEALNEEIISLARELKMRDQEIQEYSVKTEMLGKRADVARGQADQIHEMQRDLEKTRAEMRAYEEEIGDLVIDKKNLTHENQVLRQASEAAKAAAMAGDYGVGGGGARMPTDLLGLRGKVTSLQESVSYLRKENAHLRGRCQFRDEQRMLSVAEPLVRERRAASSDVGEVVREARAAALEACRLAAMPKLVRLVGPGDKQGSGWKPLSSRPQYELYRQQSLAQALKQRAEGVQDRLRSIARRAPPHALSAGGMGIQF